MDIPLPTRDHWELFEYSPDAIIGMDARGEVVYANEAALRLFDYAKSELLGQPIEVLVPDRFREAHVHQRDAFLAQTLARPMGVGGNLRGRRKDGSEVPVDIMLRPAETTEGNVVLAAVRDATERIRIEAELRQAKEAAETASRAKSEFLANMSHEIRTPMNGILGMTELALDTELTADQRDYLDTVRTCAESLLAIIDDILDFSKIEAGKLGLSLEAFSLRELLDGVMRPLCLRAHQKGLELAYRIAPDLPDRLIGDPVRLRQVIVNLVGNAIKFTEHGEVIVDVECEMRNEAGIRVRFAVRDTGVGIPEDRLQHIFRPFEQADTSTTRKYGGTGLGLTISARLVEAMGGKLEVRSIADWGSTFYFTAALRIDESVENTAILCEEALRDLRVLVVDDNQTNRRILDEMLRGWGAQPTSVSDARAAMGELLDAAVAGRPFSLALLDAMMPEVDGFMLAERIRKTPDLTNATVMMLSSANRREDANRCQELGIARYLVKPIRQTELLDAVLMALGQVPRRGSPFDSVAGKPTPEPTRALRILLAEDNSTNRHFVARLLSKASHSVTAVENGQEALAALEVGQYDVLLLDVQMPVLDGLATATAIRERETKRGGHLPIIALTAHALQGDRERCLQAGMDAYVSKPIRREMLMEALVTVTSASAVRTTSSRPSEVSWVSWDAVLAHFDGDEQLLREVGQVFIEESSALVARLEEAVRRADSEQLVAVAHTLRGSVGNYLVDALTHQLEQIERCGRERNPEAAATLLPSCRKQLDQLVDAIATHCGCER